MIFGNNGGMNKMKSWLRSMKAGVLLLSAVVALTGPAASLHAAPPLDVTGAVPTEFGKLASAVTHTAALRTDGTVWTWGRNTEGQLGYTYSGLLPRRVDLPGAAADIAAGESHTMALLADGTVRAWGSNGYGQLGNPYGPNDPDKPEPVQVLREDGSPLSGVKAIAAGSLHSLALDANGRIWAWGYNGSGQLGTGEEYVVMKAKPVLKADGSVLTGVTEVQAGAHFSMALADGQVYTWGNPSDGQLGRTVSEAVYAKFPGPVPELAGMAHIYTGPASRFGFAVASVTNAVYAWGSNVSGQLGVGPSGGSLAQPVPVPGLQAGAPVLAMAAGSSHAAALIGDGSGTRLYVTGSNTRGQQGRESGIESGYTSFTEHPALAGAKGIAAGSLQSFVLKADGKVYAFGDNTNLQLGVGIAGGVSTRTDLPVMPLSEEGRMTFAGEVRDINTGLPIEGAHVRLDWDGTSYGDEIAAVTDAAGRFAFTALAPGAHKVSIDADGYEFRDNELWGEVLMMRPHMGDRTYYLSSIHDPVISSFVDTARERGFLEGELYWYSEEYDAAYEVWFVDADGRRAGTGPVARAETGALGEQKAVAVTRRSLPEGVTGLRMFQSRGGVLTPTGAWKAMVDFAEEDILQERLRVYDRDGAPSTVNPELKWKPEADRSGFTGYRLFRFNFGGQYEDLRGPNPLARLLQREGLTASYYPYSEIAYMPKDAAQYYDPGLRMGRNEILLLLPVDAYGHLGMLYNWSVFYAPDNSSGPDGVPAVSVNENYGMPEDVIFYDEDPETGRIGGSVAWTEGAGAEGTAYSIYAVDANLRKLKRLGQVYGATRYDIPPGTPIPEGTAGISVVASDFCNCEGPLGAANTVPLLEMQSSLPRPAGVTMTDVDGEPQSLTGMIRWTGVEAPGLLRYDVHLLNHWGLPVRTLGTVRADAASPKELWVGEIRLPHWGPWFIGVTAVTADGRSGMAAAAPQPPGVSFTDVDWTAGKLGGTVAYAGFPPYGAVRYEAYGEKADGSMIAVPLGTAPGRGPAMVRLASGTPFPEGAVKVALYAVMQDGTEEVRHLLGRADLRDLKLDLGEDPDPSTLDVEDLLLLIRKGSLSETDIHPLLNHVSPRSPGYTRVEPLG